MCQVRCTLELLIITDLGQGGSSFERGTGPLWQKFRRRSHRGKRCSGTPPSTSVKWSIQMQSDRVCHYYICFRTYEPRVTFLLMEKTCHLQHVCMMIINTMALFLLIHVKYQKNQLTKLYLIVSSNDSGHSASSQLIPLQLRCCVNLPNRNSEQSSC